MPFKLTVTQNIPLPAGIVGDQFPDLSATPGSGLLPSAYHGGELDFDIKFEYQEGEDTAPVLQVILPSSLGVEGVSATVKGADTVNIKGRAVVFTDEIWEFVFPDGTKKILPPLNGEPYKSIVKWAPPGSREKLATYNFRIKYDDNAAAATPIVGATVNTEVKQYFYWKYEPSLELFKVLVAKGPNYKET